MAVFCPLSTQPVFFQGAVQIGAEITVYDAGTLTPRTAYRDGPFERALRATHPHRCEWLRARNLGRRERV